MTFTEIVNRVASRLNQTQAASLTRIGESVNDVYRTVTTAVGLGTSRRTEAQANATPGSQFLTFTGVEKVISVVDRSTGSARFLTEVTIDELDRMTVADSDVPTVYAIYRANADNVQIKMNVNPQTAFTLYAPAYVQAPTLSGTQEPAFPESFHDILVSGVLFEEYMKLEKVPLAKIQEAKYEDRLGDLRLFIQTSPQQDIYRSKNAGSTQSHTGGSGGSGGGSIDGTQSYTQTGLVTFDRTGAAPGSRAPFAVATGSEKVANFDADLLDGESGSFYTNADNCSTGTLSPERLAEGVSTVMASTEAASQDDWDPGFSGDSVIYWSGASNITITGLLTGPTDAFVPLPNAPGQRVRIVNVGTAIIRFAHQDAGSIADNRLRNLFTSAVTPVAAGGFIEYQYDGSRWQMIAHEQGAFIAYIPAWTGSVSDPVVNNGTITGRYRIQGLQVFFSLAIAMGAGTTYGSGTYSFSLPVAAVSAVHMLGNGRLFDSGTNSRLVLARKVTASTFALYQDQNTGSGINPTVPFTFAVNDQIEVQGDYEVA